MNQTKRVEQSASGLVMYATRLARAVRRTVETDLPAAQLRVLSQLDELGPSSITDLAIAERCSQPTMSATVSSVVERGWARRTLNPRDARSQLVVITDTGSDVLASFRADYGARLVERLAPYSAAELDQAVALIKHLLENDK